MLWNVPVLKWTPRTQIHQTSQWKQQFSELGYKYACLKPKLDNWKKKMLLDLFKERYTYSLSAMGHNRKTCKSVQPSGPEGSTLARLKG